MDLKDSFRGTSYAKILNSTHTKVSPFSRSHKSLSIEN